MQTKAHSLLARTCTLALFCVAAVSAASAQSTSFRLLLSFDRTDGYAPYASLIQGTDGNFYGTTEFGGAYDHGTVFKTTSTGGLTTLHSFDDSDGYWPYAPLVQGTDGNFYGTTPYGGTHCAPGGCGTIFKITPEGVLTTVYNFGGADGIGPGSGLIQASDGNFYGTTIWGGSNYECNSGCGTIFKITPEGVLSTLYNFCSQPNCADGWYPLAGLLQTADGNMYGTTEGGGANPLSGCAYGECGTVFKISPTGTLTTLYSFCSQPTCSDGSAPGAGVVQDADGNFYGTTFYGGGGGCLPGCGTVFKLSPSGTLTTLHSFSFTDGAYPSSGLVQGVDGNFYGTTPIGGTGPCDFSGCGTVFRITPTGTLTTLHKFVGWDGQSPRAGLIQAADGSFYGTTQYGGAYCNYGGCGTVFRLGIVHACATCRP